MAVTLACTIPGRPKERRFTFARFMPGSESIFGRNTPRDPEQMRQQLHARKEKLTAPLTEWAERRAEDIALLRDIRFHIGTAILFSPVIAVTISQPSEWPVAPFAAVSYIILGVSIGVYSAAIAIRKFQFRRLEKQESELPPAPIKIEYREPHK